VRAGGKFGVWNLDLYVNNVADRRGLLGGGAGEFPPIGFQYILPRTAGVNLSMNF